MKQDNTFESLHSLATKPTTQQYSKVGFFEVVTPWVAREFLFARRNLVLGSHAFASSPIWSNQSFTDSQNYALSGDIRFIAEK